MSVPGFTDNIGGNLNMYSIFDIYIHNAAYSYRHFQFVNHKVQF